jgi:hypothetical protein
MKITVDPTQANTIYTLFTSTNGIVLPNPPVPNSFMIFYSVNGVNVSDVILLTSYQSSISYWIHHTGGFAVTTLLTYFPSAIQVDDISN